MVEETTPNGAREVTKTRGRPRAGTHAAVSVWLPNSEYDRILKIAKAQDRSVSAVAGALLRLALTRTP